MGITGDLRGLARAGNPISGANTRPLTAAEIAEARTVFQDTIDYGRVTVADALGPGGRPFTLLWPVMGVESYTLFMGPRDFAAMGDWPTLIHELTHVWQGQNHYISCGYMLDSGISPAIDGNAAHDDRPGDIWGGYNVEQQAHLVEDWYAADGKSVSSPRYYYIENCIRKPWRAWFGGVSGGLGAAAASRG